jgi:glucose/mannose transport system substrate-binding protein
MSATPRRFRRGKFRLLEVALLALAALLLALGAACGGDDDEEGEGGGAETQAEAATEIEVFSWWTGGGEAAGLEKMIEIWNREHPNTQFKNAAVAGGAGTNAKAVLAQRLAANDPPDSFQGHAGAELLDYITAGQLEPIDDIYEEAGLADVFPEQLLEQIRYEGKLYSVPVNIHRANVLWYSPAVLEEAGIDGPPESMDDFVAALEKVKATGKIPLVAAEQWTVKHLLETVLLAELGTDGYAALWESGADWSGSDVTAALERFAEIMTYTNPDAASLTWQDASKLVVDGKAAFNIMGDWANGYFTELGKQGETDYGWAPVPGTDGVYQWLSDSFTLPKNAPHRAEAVEWLKLCGSQEGQDAFNPVKGSIPARDDADESKYNEYLQTALDDWKSDELAGSLTHGVVASNAWNTEVDTALGLFLQNKDVAEFQEALSAAAEKHAA